ncbi:helix-turn-helix domain-containing protein [Treponema berlinense]|uniref:helix-turn-helix domain-containing protein n=1 Tax=Treponema berlinense TaxID=225004 RepID=UPI002353E38E|nr:helix-turn-helix transcriptional regulator [Treponema berlinense]MCI5542250.1 helix-turn-helix domain-containing protein [Treponema berlinense]MDD5835372.1 helix-turn-helix transcriptional regulator [Treponema berlinense]MDY3708590.1 helix-turn-helix transcriptional regulator [Treponema berlinense]
MSFWQNVEREIEYKGISRKELAFRANIAYQGIGLGIERESMPRVDTALKIAKVLEVPLEYLINEKDLEIRPAAEGLSKEEKKQTDQNKSSSLHQTENQYIEFYRRNRKIIDSLEKIPSAIKQPIESMIIHIATVY